MAVVAMCTKSVEATLNFGCGVYAVIAIRTTSSDHAIWKQWLMTVGPASSVLNWCCHWIWCG